MKPRRTVSSNNVLELEHKPTDPLLTIKSELGWSVIIRYDGKLEYSEGYDPDAAARIFWEALADSRPALDRDVGGISPELEEKPADEWPYPDDPPDPL